MEQSPETDLFSAETILPWTYDHGTQVFYGDQHLFKDFFEGSGDPKDCTKLSEVVSYLHEDDREGFNQLIELDSKQGLSKKEVRVTGLQTRWIMVVCNYLSNLNISNGVFVDTSRRRRTLLKYRLKNLLHHKIEILNNSAGFEWIMNADELNCSDNFFEVTKLKQPTDNVISSHTFFDLIENNAQAFVADVMHDCIVRNEPFEVTFDSSHMNPRRFKLHGFPQGNIQYRSMTGILEDVTEKIEQNNALIKGQDLERKRVSLEIHDSVGQKLVAIKYRLAYFNMTQDFKNFGELNTTIDEIIEEIRTITHNLSNEIVKEVGLRQSLSQLLNETAKNLEADPEFLYAIPLDIDVPDEYAKMIFRIVQESLSNALKYSKATKIVLKVQYISKQIHLEIKDNGVGFDLSLLKNPGIGLTNIQERISFLSGFLKVESNPGEGTLLKIRIPLYGKN